MHCRILCSPCCNTKCSLNSCAVITSKTPITSTRTSRKSLPRLLRWGTPEFLQLFFLHLHLSAEPSDHFHGPPQEACPVKIHGLMYWRSTRLRPNELWGRSRFYARSAICWNVEGIRGHSLFDLTQATIAEVTDHGSVHCKFNRIKWDEPDDVLKPRYS